ncbi:MAG: DUF815 domain-containing protein [Chroococcales cyanobacterium]
MTFTSSPNAAILQSLQEQIASLLLYQSVLDNEVGQAFIQLLEALRYSKNNELTCLHAYGTWFKALAARNQSWQDYLIHQILLDENPFSQQVQRLSLEASPTSLIAAAKQDLQALQSLYECNTQQLSQLVQGICKTTMPPVVWNLETRYDLSWQQEDDWGNAIADLAQYYRKHGVGLFGQYTALRWQQGRLEGILSPDPVQLTDIVGYESQREALQKNTEFLLAGYPALHVLLYGSRGTGKSSLVKGLLQKYAEQGLRLIEVAKSELKALPIIIEKLREIPQKFIIFVDDLSFEEDDDAFKALKVVLEGSVTAKAQNVVVYATSNRRHLVREYFADRPRPSDADEIHAWDSVQEKLSFSDRFGLTLTFEPTNQDTYLTIVSHLAKQAKIHLPQEELEFRAKQWATQHNGRSGRTAKQFIDFLQAELNFVKS